MESDLKEYEISFLLPAEANRPVLENVLTSAGAAVTYQEPLKEIRLAYPIGKHASAFFGFDYFKAEPAMVKAMRDSLILKPEVLRFLIITPPVPRKIRGTEEVRIAKGAPPAMELPPTSPATLSNEALEQKLEEILK